MQMKKGVAVCLQLLAKEPKNISYLRLIAAIEYQLGNPAAAEKWLKKALKVKPDSAELHYHHAHALMGQEKTADSLFAFAQAVALKPDYTSAHYYMGSLFEKCGDDDKALKSYTYALKIKPAQPKTLNKMGSVLMRKGNLSAAEDCFKQANALNPDDPAPINNLGVVYANAGNFDSAADCYRRALLLKPNYPEALNNWGKLSHFQGNFSESISFCQQALLLRPDFSEALNILGSSLQAIGNLDEAIGAYRKAIAISRSNPGYHTNLAISLLTAGYWDEGWRKYEWRLKSRQLAPEWENISTPHWQGNVEKDCVLLIKAEQGMGDTLQFCRYIPFVLARGMQVLLEVQPPLARLMESLVGAERVFAKGQPLPHYDCYCPMMSLPLIFATRPDKIPASIPYLSVRESDLSRWKQHMPQNEGLLKVGLVWAGSSRAHSPGLVATDRRRSVAPEMFAPLMDITGIHFYSLQKLGPKALSHWNLTDLMDDCGDFLDTAALVANLDLIISVDTAVAHLAGALGKQIWLLNRFDTCWRWQLGREDSPWYPTMRLFRQQQPGNWEDVISRVKTELRQLAALQPTQ